MHSSLTISYIIVVLTMCVVVGQTTSHYGIGLVVGPYYPILAGPKLCTDKMYTSKISFAIYMKWILNTDKTCARQVESLVHSEPTALTNKSVTYHN